MLQSIEEFRSAIASAGYEPPEEITPGKFHRFSANGKRSDKAGFCMMFEDMRGGVFGDFRAGVTHDWQMERSKEMTPQEREQRRQDIERARRERDEALERLRAEVREKAKAIWESSPPADDTHPYLVKKGVKAHNVRLSNGKLVVPLKDAQGQLHSLQFIDDDGNKRFLTGGRKLGCYSGIGKPDGCIHIAEGYATAASIHESTGHAVAIAFDAGNLEPVALALRERFPDIKIVIAADNDVNTPGNPGMTKATLAASKIGATVVAPDAGDFNDLAQTGGHDAVVAVIDRPMHVEKDPATEMIEDWVFVSALRKFIHKPTMRAVDVDAFNMEHLHLMEFFPEHRKMKPAEYLRRVQNSEVVHDLMYLPTMWNGNPVFSMDGIKYLNTYNEISVPKVEPGWQQHDAWQICLQHLQNILPQDWEALLLWMAHNVQHPGRKILWAPVIVGMPGDGKTTIAKMLTAAMGRKHTQVVGMEGLRSDFNGWAEGKCLSTFEEIRVPGHSRHDFMNKLKTLITNDVVDVVAKGKNSKNVANTQNYIALSNFRDALVLDPDDRRWGVFFTRFNSREEVTAQMDKDYWARLNDYAIRDNPGVIRGWLMSIDLSQFDRNEGPVMTQAKRYMISHSMSADAQSIDAILTTGARGVSLNVVETKALNVALKDMENRTIQTSRMSAALSELKFEKVKDVIKWDGRKCHVWVRKPVVYDGSPEAKAAIRDALDANAPLAPFFNPMRPQFAGADRPF